MANKLNLSKKDIEKLIDSIDNPVQPNDELKKAANKYKQQTTDKTFKKKSLWTKINKNK